MNGPYVRIARGRVTVSAAAAIDDPAFDGDGPKDQLCYSGAFQVEEYHRQPDETVRLRLGSNGQKAVKFINGWRAQISVGTRGIFAQFADGRWEMIAEACEE